MLDQTVAIILKTKDYHSNIFKLQISKYMWYDFQASIQTRLWNKVRFKKLSFFMQTTIYSPFLVLQCFASGQLYYFSSATCMVVQERASNTFSIFLSKMYLEEIRLRPKNLFFTKAIYEQAPKLLMCKTWSFIFWTSL